MARFKDNTAGFKRRLIYAQKRALKASAELIEASAQATAPRDTGQLAASITTQQASKQRMYVGSALQYAYFVERGTGEHAIYGGRKGGWVYPVIGQTDKDGKPLFRYTYGMEPTRFLETAFADNVDNVQRIVEKYFSQLK